jgi:polyhydroxyalkanoate synthesis regulator protein
MQMLVPRYLEASIDTLSREQGKFRDQMAQAFGVTSFGPLEDMARRNMEAFERAFAMFAPFGRPGGAGPANAGAAATDGDKPRESGEIDDLKKQMDEMQKRLDRLSDKDKPPT